MHKGLVAFVVLFILIIVAFYFTKGDIFSSKTSTTIFSGSTITSLNSTSTTTIQNYTTNTLISCADLSIDGFSFNTIYTAHCNWTGGLLGLWVAAGYSGNEGASILGVDGKNYLTQSSNFNCTTFYENVTLPAQNYTVTFITGNGGGPDCGNAQLVLNTTTTPPQIIYNYIFNGNFSNGQYTGWNESFYGFGSAPLNITYADSKMCYLNAPWSGYNGIYFATTYECGTNVAPGNLTSLPFLVNPETPFLNFKLISPEQNAFYIEILRENYQVINHVKVYINTKEVIIAHADTFNTSITSNSSSTFANVSIPLTPYINQVLKIKIVAGGAAQGFIAAGDFVLARRPNLQRGVILNISTNSS